MEKKTTLSLIKNSASYDLIISNTLENKIRYTLSQLPQTEWSGILFWKKTGTFKENTLKIFAEDFLILDIGDVTSTAFDMTPAVIGYMVQHGLTDSNIGLIHSHHTMTTFFSAVDTNTLLTEGQKSNHFLSLIVNNKREYSAAITRQIESVQVISEIKTYKTFEDAEIKTTDNVNVTEEYIEYFQLNISFEKENTFTELQNDIDALLKAKKVESKSKELPQLTTQQLLWTTNWDMNYKNPYFSTSTNNSIKNLTIHELLCKILSLNQFTHNEQLSLWVKDKMEDYLDSFYYSYDDYLHDIFPFIKNLNLTETQITQLLEEIEKFTNNDYLDCIYSVLTQL